MPERSAFCEHLVRKPPRFWYTAAHAPQGASRMRVRVSGAALVVLVALALTGCAKRARVTKPPRMTKVESLSGPHFAYGDDNLTPAGRAKVHSAAAMLNQYPNRRVDVNGYTDAMGSDEYN